MIYVYTGKQNSVHYKTYHVIPHKVVMMKLEDNKGESRVVIFNDISQLDPEEKYMAEKAFLNMFTEVNDV